MEATYGFKGKFHGDEVHILICYNKDIHRIGFPGTYLFSKNYMMRF